MARALNQKLRLRGALVAKSPLSVGGMHDDGLSDLTLARDGQDRLYIPGTTLAGCIRNVLALSDKEERLIWGGANDEDAASLIAVQDAPLCGGSSVSVRDGVGIDRVEGRAVSGFKYDRQVVDPGAWFSFMLEIEVPGGADKDPARRLTTILSEIRWLLEGGHIAFGAATTKGHGVLVLEGASVERLPLDDRDGFLTALESGAWLDATSEVLAREPEDAAPWLDIIIDWRPLGPVMVKAREQGEAVDALPFVSVVDGELHQTLPGASIRGALRSAAERIMRTVAGDGQRDRQRAVPPEDMRAERNRFTEMLVEDPLVALLFGRDRPAGKTAWTDRSGSRQQGVVAGKAALIVRDTHTTLAIPGTVRDGMGLDATELTQVPEMLAQGAPPEQSNHAWTHAQAAMHVAVDRWTGGAAGNLLFSGFEPWGAEFDPIRLRVDGTRLPADRQTVLCVLALLLLTLREMHEGQIPLGFATTRGYGDVTVERFSVSTNGKGSGDVAEAFATLNGLEIGTVNDWSTGVLRERLADLIAAWTAYLDEADRKQDWDRSEAAR